MQYKKGLVSVVMPTYNSSSTVLNSVMSVLSQDYDNLELIVCDDGSNDDTLEILYGINDDRINIISNRLAKGAAGARNSCLLQAKGQYVAFLDSDDIWGSRKLSNQVSFMEANQVRFCFSDYYVFKDEPNKTIGHFSAKETISHKDLLFSCDIGCLTVMFNRKSSPDFSFPLCDKEDYAAWLLLTSLGEEFVRSPHVDCYYRLSLTSVSSNKLKEIPKQYNVLRRFGRTTKLSALFYLITYIFKGGVKHVFSYRNNK